MRRTPILVSRRRYFELAMRPARWAEAFADQDPLARLAAPAFGEKIAGRIPRGVTSRHRTLIRRKVRSCIHAHISGGGQAYDGDWMDYQCDDCGDVCPDLAGRARVVRP